MRYIAKQVPPEHQWSPYDDEDEFPEDIIICGNGKMSSIHEEDFDMMCARLDDMAEHLDKFGEFTPGYYKNITAMIYDFAPREDGTPYSTNDIAEWKRIIKQWWSNAYSTVSVERCVVDALSLVRHTPYECRDINGCSQSDWNTIFYPTSYKKEFIEELEIGYFNEGTMWRVYQVEDDEDDMSDLPYEISVYCYGWNEEKQKAEILDFISGYYGGYPEPEQLKMYVYDGDIVIPKYKLYG